MALLQAAEAEKDSACTRHIDHFSKLLLYNVFTIFARAPLDGLRQVHKRFSNVEPIIVILGITEDFLEDSFRDKVFAFSFWALGEDYFRTHCHPLTAVSLEAFYTQLMPTITHSDNIPCLILTVAAKACILPTSPLHFVFLI